jgi:hypothetical protein
VFSVNAAHHIGRWFVGIKPFVKLTDQFGVPGFVGGISVKDFPEDRNAGSITEPGFELLDTDCCDYFQEELTSWVYRELSLVICDSTAGKSHSSPSDRVVRNSLPPCRHRGCVSAREAPTVQRWPNIVTYDPMRSRRLSVL